MGGGIVVGADVRGVGVVVSGRVGDIGVVVVVVVGGVVFVLQAEDGIRVLVRSRGLGDVYKGQGLVVSRAGGEQGWW